MSYNPTQQSLSLNQNNVQLKITVLNQHTYHVWATNKTNNKGNNPYAVVGKPIKTSVNYIENTPNFNLNTPLVNCEISDTLKITFSTKNNQIINQDDPDFGFQWLDTEVTNYKTLQPNERFVGLGEKTGGINKAGSGFSNWNTDYFAYPESANELYSTIPFYIGIHNGLCYGIFFDNTHRTTFNFGASNKRFAYFSADNGPLNYYFIYGETIGQIIQQYTQLTGAMPLPPKWSLGLQQCRYSYYPDTEVLRVAQTFREKQIPCDVMYFDIHYMDKYKVFTWDKTHFSQPKKMLSTLDNNGFKTVAIIDPGVKVETDYEPYESGVKNDVFVKYPNGEYWSADVWPGTCNFPDYTNPKTRQWWASYFKGLVNDGLNGFWNDMNEPASWGQCTPNLLQFNFEGEGANHREARNVYGMQMSRATFNGAKQALNNQRAFILTRATYAGGQRFAAKWTGDNVASDENMLMGVRMISSLGLSGMPFSGYDVGGFCGNATPELFARWISIGAFSPMFRCHSMINSNSAEPWAYGEEVTEIARNYVNLRYQLLPYIYACFYKAHLQGTPIQQALCYQYPHDSNVYESGIENQYMFGPNILVGAVSSNERISKIYLPKGTWYDLYNDQVYQGNQHILIESPLDRLPLFVKAGSIMPLQPKVQHTGQTHNGTLSLHIYQGKGSFTLYDDDGISYDYENDNFNLYEINLTENKLSFNITKQGFNSVYKQIKVYLHGFKNLNLGNLKHEDYQFMVPISNFDPFEKREDNSKTIKQLPYVMINSLANFEIEF